MQGVQQSIAVATVEPGAQLERGTLHQRSNANSMVSLFEPARNTSFQDLDKIYEEEKAVGECI